jgi:hypothetical protein
LDRSEVDGRVTGEGHGAAGAGGGVSPNLSG